ncbi:unnamed protein product [Brassica rapa]|uniref:Uncharacterized protein n=1 Tax=Brassica campestris TaxID=3711 RepID=A0A3P5ZUW8_BRACM|nr:unnamed protein product [Brassica rapa]VDC76200.1 unnamed protein product [Brassica rapa]
MPIWIDLKGVPSLMFSQKALKCLSRAACKFVKLYPSTERCVRLDVARVLVEVNLQKPLVEKISCLDKDGKEVLIDVIYPWLPPRCNVCAAWGHKGNSCSSTNIQALQKGKEKEVLGGQVSSEEGSHGGGEVRFEVNANHSVVNELLLELQGLPSALGSDAGREMEWKGDGADGSVSSGSGKETVNGENVEWDLVEETSHQQFLRMISNP